jgi:hypothetical protein
LPPASNGDVSQGFKLSDTVDFQGNKTGSIVFNTDNQIDSNGGCDLEGLDVSFR